MNRSTLLPISANTISAHQVKSNIKLGIHMPIQTGFFDYSKPSPKFHTVAIRRQSPLPVTPLSAAHSAHHSPYASTKLMHRANMYLSIQLILPLLASFSDILCQDKIHRLPGPPVSKCRAKTKWLIIDEEGERWTILHRPRKVERFADQVIWYSYDMAPLDLGEVVANKKKELGIGELVKVSNIAPKAIFVVKADPKRRHRLRNRR